MNYLLFTVCIKYNTQGTAGNRKLRIVISQKASIQSDPLYQVQYKKILNTMCTYGRIIRYMDKFMIEALKEAEKARNLGEIPIGAVIVKDNEIISRGHNLTETTKDPTAHAEMIAIRNAAKVLGGWRLLGCDMYVTIEPCSMCAGALVWSRIRKLYIGSRDPKAGACGSVLNIVQNERLNHQIETEVGIMEAECCQIVKGFFHDLRNKKKNKKSEEQK